MPPRDRDRVREAVGGVRMVGIDPHQTGHRFDRHGGEGPLEHGENLREKTHVAAVAQVGAGQLGEEQGGVRHRASAMAGVDDLAVIADALRAKALG